MQHSKEDIFNQTKAVMVKLFEIDEDQYHLEAKLYEDLDIDSIDAVDLMIELKKFTGVKINQENFRGIRTVSDVVETVYKITQSA